MSFTGVTSLELFDNGTGGDDVASDGIYYGQYEVPVSSNLYRDLVTGVFVDGAGNEALPTPAVELLNINTPPDPVVLSLSLNVLGQFEFTWTLSQEPDFQSYRLYSGTSLPVDTNSTLVQIFPDPNVSLFVAPQQASTIYRLYVVDQHGAVAGSNTVPTVP